MNDIDQKKDLEIVPANVLAKQGVSAIAQIAGGILIFIMHIFSAKLMPLGIVFGLIIGGIGISGLLSKDSEDKKPGTLLTAAGILKLLSHVGPAVLRGLAGTLLAVSSLGLAAMGIINGIKFLKGLKSRQ